MAQIAWLIPRLIDGSGGHRTMLQHAHALEQRGHTCFLYIEGTGAAGETAAQHLERAFGYRFANAQFGWYGFREVDLAVATIWYSAAIVRDWPFACKKAYFVQDYEASFNPMGDAYLLAENSYSYGLVPITIGRWLRHELKARFDVMGYHFDFGADLSVYKRLPLVEKEMAVCFIYQPDKPRRCARIGIEALGIVKHRMPQVKVYLYGSREKGSIWFPHENLGLLRLDQCNELYNRCAVGLCLSSSNPSRIPFEMMAAGLPVVEMWRENTLYDFPDEAVTLCQQTPEAIAEGLLSILSDAVARDRMGVAGETYMRGRPLSIETDQFVDTVERVMRAETPDPAHGIERLYGAPPITAGHYVGELPTEIRRRLAAPPNARVNALPPPLRKFVAWGARTARRMLENR